jgi:hypothetical protein
MMQALLIFFALFFFLCDSFIFALTFYFSFIFCQKCCKNQNSIQTNQQTLYQPDTDSLLNIAELI